MAHGDAREGKWKGNCRMEWAASTLHTTSEHDVSGINTADAHISATSSRLTWRLRRFKWTRPFRRKTKCGFCACAITFQTQSTCRWWHTEITRSCYVVNKVFSYQHFCDYGHAYWRKWSSYSLTSKLVGTKYLQKLTTECAWRLNLSRNLNC